MGDSWFNKTEKLTDLNLVKKRIEEITDKVAGKNKGIVEDSITLTAYSASYLDLILLDLPRINKNSFR